MVEVVQLDLPDDIKRELEMLSRSEGKSKNEIIKDAIVKYITVKKFRELRKRAIAYISEDKLLSDEDIFNLVS